MGNNSDPWIGGCGKTKAVGSGIATAVINKQEFIIKAAFKCGIDLSSKRDYVLLFVMDRNDNREQCDG
jgi:hypothetical protein